MLSGGCADGAQPVPGGTGASAETTTGAGPTTSAPANAMNDVSPGDACPHTADRFTFFVAGYGADGFGCGAATGKLTRSAVVTGVDSASIEGSRPAPARPRLALGRGAPCEERLTLTVVAAPDFTLPLILGAYVHVEATVTVTEPEGSTPADCAQTLEVTNLPSYGGMASSVDPRPILWFAGADGTLATPPDAASC